jgi:hypothetical protein
MLKGQTIQDLVANVESINDRKRDFVGNTTKMEMLAVPGDMMLGVQGQGEFKVNPVAHGQIAAKLGIPKRYYDRMKVDQPELLARNVNIWMHQEPSDRMVRTIDDTARAFLSNRYKPMDNLEVLSAALPVLKERDDLRVISAELTEKRMYIQIMFETLNKNVGLEPYSPGSSNMKVTDKRFVNDVVNFGMVISNSEVGLGMFSIESVIFRVMCANCLIAAEAMSKKHIGRALSQGEALPYDFYSEKTLKLGDATFQSQVEDTVRNTISQENLDKMVFKIDKAQDNLIPVGKVQSVVKEVTKKFTFAENESEGLLSNLIEGGMLNQWGMVNAVTATAKDADYDRGIEMERIGGEILDLPSTQWESITK